MGFYFYRRISPDQKWSTPLLPGLTTRRCGHWRRHPPNAQLMTLTPWTIARIPTSPKSNASFLTSYCSWGRSPKNMNPTGYCGPPAKSRATEAGVAGRSLPGQGGLSAGIPSDRSRRSLGCGPSSYRPRQRSDARTLHIGGPRGAGESDGSFARALKARLGGSRDVSEANEVPQNTRSVLAVEMSLFFWSKNSAYR
jgi:hypothetical protein